MIRKPKKRLHGSPEIELRPDGWERFKTAVAAAAKSGPKHRKPKVLKGKQFANVQEAVDWIYANAPSPDAVVYVSKPPSTSVRLSRKPHAFGGRSKTDT
jgi:hypothetical protein